MHSQSYSRKLAVVLMFILLFIPSYAQKLLKSRQSSYLTYIYEISDKEAAKINKRGVYKVDSTYFHNLVDSYPTDSVFSKRLLPGHYLKTYSQQNKQNVSYTFVPDFDVKILNNNTDLCIQVYDLNGNNLPNVVVKIGLKTLHFDKKTQCYLDRKSNQKGILKVSRDGNTAYYQLSRKYNNPALLRGARSILYGTPLKYVWFPVSYIINIPIDGVKSIIRGQSTGVIWRTYHFFRNLPYNVGKLFDRDEKNRDFSRNYKGYMVFNKPKYMPGDTVKFKAFIVDKKGKPLTKTVNVELYNGKKYFQLKELKPYRNGAYESRFFIHDSLDLKLDRSYSIELENKDRSTYISGNFYYEQYELAKNKLVLRTESDNHFKGKSLSVFAKGTDENGLNLLDARLQIIVKPNSVSTYFDNRTFIPDTLYVLKKELRPTGETEILIPDSVFPKVNLNYTLDVRLLTSDNEIITEEKQLSYFYTQKRFDIKLINDSIQFTYLENDQPVSWKVDIYATDNFGFKTDLVQTVTPCKVKLNPFYNQYCIKSDSLFWSFNMASQSSLLQCMSQRTKDSVFVEVNNPRKLNFTYNIYKKNTEKLRGSGDSLSVRQHSAAKENYFISLRYLWGGKIKEESYRIPFFDKNLNIAVKQSRIVYPGQKVNLEINVTDQAGKPVPNVDLTAYSLTSKFDYDPPKVPYLGKLAANKAVINNFTLKDNKMNETCLLPLNYESWKKFAAIDSIEYYKFLYPGTQLYRFEYKPANKITQFSPYVVSNKGDLIPVKVIYVDSKPLYFSWSTIKQPYSFQVDSGYHTIKLRTAERSITLDSLYFNQGKKVVFSLQEKLATNHIKSEKAETTLSQHERNVLFRYIFPYRNTFGEKYAWIEDDNFIQLLNPVENKRYNQQNFAGPVSGDVTFNLKDGYSTNFNHEAFFEYDFAPNLLKMREINKKYYPDIQSYFSPDQEMSDEVLTKQKIETDWKDYMEMKRREKPRYNYPISTQKGFGKLNIDIQAKKQQTFKTPLNILMFRYDTPNFLRIYPGNISLMHQLEKGLYRIIIFYPGSSYQVVDSIDIKTNGLNYCLIQQPITLPKDSFSIYVSDLIEKNLFKPIPDFYSEKSELGDIYNQYQKKYTYDGEGNTISGVVYEESTKEALIGVSINIKGTSYGVISDIEGRFTIKIPADKHILLISYIGFISQEIDLNRTNTTAIGLKEDFKHLDEVVVIGYGTMKKSDLTGAVSTISSNDLIGSIPDVSGNISQALQGRLAGIDVGNPGGGTSIRIRGTSSIDFNQTPLFVIDGNIFTGNIKDLDPALIEKIEVLKDASATAIYGSRGANGVIIIATKPGTFKTTKIEELKGADYDNSFLDAASKASSIRNKFSDYAYWQPRLTTDKEGKASFEVTFPDDVTNWETFVLAMNDKKQSGQTAGNIKSYKPLMAQLALPTFILEKDTTFVIGKSLNYTPDSVNITTAFEVNGKKAFSRNKTCINSVLDTLQIIAPHDSITIRYSLTKPDGYFDGEQRQIPVYRIGLEETKGNFLILNNDTTISRSFDSSLGEVTLYAHADYLNVLEEEIGKLSSYKYYCNEQIASKLKALLAERLIAKYAGKEPKNENKIESLIRLLLKNRKKDGLWGWWKDSDTHYQFSLYILDALNQAKNQGFKLNLDESKLAELLIYELDNTSTFDISLNISMLKTLKAYNGVINYKAYVDKLEKTKNISLNNYLKLLELKQLCGLECKTDTLKKIQQNTLFGNIYYADKLPKNSLYDNDIQNTLLAYRILKNKNQSDTVSAKIRRYFLEMKQSSGWRNTYESAQILETILPDVLGTKSKWEKSVLKLNGDVNTTVTKFPFELKLKPEQKINITKTGSDPIYLTTYQHNWNKTPKLKSGDFVITTHFEDNSLHLVAGKPTKLIVNLEVTKDADFVMLNVPIPGGCSYGEKGSYFKNEVHREYFKNETDIFCQKLKKGSYVFEINLIPRFNGKYTLNPSKVELMYFPSFNANNEVKKVTIN